MTDVLTRSERPEPVLGAADVAVWSGGALERLITPGVLAATTPAESFACDACGFDHVEPVQWERTPGQPVRACICCAVEGVVWLNPDDLRRWVVRLPVLAERVGAAVGATGGIRERVPGRVWKLGTVRAGGRAWVAHIAIGLARLDGATVVASAPELRAPNALVFVPSTVPPPAVWGGTPPAAVVSLCDLLTLDAEGLVADLAFLESSLPAPTKPPKGATTTFPTPAGTTWEQVTLIVDDLGVEVRVAEVSRAFSFAEAGFENQRTKGKPDDVWNLFRLFAQQNGELGTGDHIKMKPDVLKAKVSKLRDRLRQLLALDADPFHPNRSGQPYRARFKIRRAGPETFPTPPGATWDDVTLTERADGTVEVAVACESRGAVFVAADAPDKPTDRGRWEGTTESGERSHRYSLASLGLTDENGDPNGAGAALLAVLRAGGRVNRPAEDEGMLVLGAALTTFFGIDAPPFEYDSKRKLWCAVFSAVSNGSGR
jgi:hypothetical protein